MTSVCSLIDVDIPVNNNRMCKSCFLCSMNMSDDWREGLAQRLIHLAQLAGMAALRCLGNTHICTYACTKATGTIRCYRVSLSFWVLGAKRYRCVKYTCRVGLKDWDIALNGRFLSYCTVLLMNECLNLVLDLETLNRDPLNRDSSVFIVQQNGS